MLKHLSVNNYALIDELEIDFHKGFSIITGETGAGKSILLGALSMILGFRADTNALNKKEEKCVIEGVFGIKEYALQHFFKENDLDYDDITTFRREISSNGKSRAFINDTPVGVSTLRDLGIQLVDIHSQHENLLLGDNYFQLKVVDAFAKHTELLLGYKKDFETYKATLSEFNTLVELSEKSKTDLDYYQFQLNQLQEANLKENEQEELEKELETLLHAEEIKSGISNISYMLSNENESILTRLKEARDISSRLVRYFPRAEEFNKRFESAYIELKDIYEEMDVLVESIEHDPGRIEVVNQRLNLIYSLQQKHKAGSVNELIVLKEKLSEKVDDISSYDFQTEGLKKKLDELVTNLNKKADQISKNRLAVIPEIEDHVTSLLKQLGIPNALFKVTREQTESLTITGTDKITFLFSANKQSVPQELAKVASGGELSRLMLSLKSLIVKSTSLPTIIFDEIDAGISGEIADKMATIMQQMSQNIQVIDITHLPQIAAKGNHHYLVYKQDYEHGAYTKIKLLENSERIIEIAKMLSGEELTDAAIHNAKELLKN